MEPPASLKTLTKESNEDLLALCRACPIVADFTFYFDREPDFFAWPELVFDDYRYAGVEVDGSLAGAVLLGWKRGWTGQGAGTFFYGGDARVIPEFRGERLGERITLQMLEELPAQAEIGWGIIKQGNLPALRSATTARSPRYDFRELGVFEACNVLPMRRVSRPARARVRHARLDDLPDMASLMARCFSGRLFAPLVTADALGADLARRTGLGIERYYVAERGGRLVGVLAAWDLSPVKRSVILRYSPWARVLRAAHRLVRLGFRQATPLPRVGQAFRSLSITQLAIADRDPDILRDLLAAVIDDHLGQGYHLIHVAFVGDDPLARSTRGLFAQRFRSGLFVATTRAAGRPDPLAGRVDPYIDLALV